MRGIPILLMLAFSLPAVAHADCDGQGVVDCSRLEFTVSSCETFTAADDPWIAKAFDKLAKKDTAAAEKMRAGYQGVLLKGTTQGATLGACGDQRPKLHPTTEQGEPPSWFVQAGACASFKVGETMTVDSPRSCCTGSGEAPCLFLEKARATTHPLLPLPVKPHVRPATATPHAPLKK